MNCLQPGTPIAGAGAGDGNGSVTAAEDEPMKADTSLAEKAAATGLAEAVPVLADAFGALDGRGASRDSPEEHPGTET